VFVTVVDVMRIYYLQLAATSLDTLASVYLTTSLEFSYNASLALLWSTVEVNVGIICACIPTLRPLIKSLIPDTVLNRASNSSGDRAPPCSARWTSPDSHNHNELHQPNSATGPAAAAVDLESVCAVQLAENQEQQIRVIDRITTPDVDPRMVLGSAPNPSEPTINSVYFGFISMKQPKSMLNTRGSKSIKYCTFVNTIFSVLGFTYVLLIVLNSEIPITANLNLT
jgi:hypothetical protein